MGKMGQGFWRLDVVAALLCASLGSAIAAETPPAEAPVTAETPEKPIAFTEGGTVTIRLVGDAVHFDYRLNAPVKVYTFGASDDGRLAYADFSMPAGWRRSGSTVTREDGAPFDRFEVIYDSHKEVWAGEESSTPVIRLAGGGYLIEGGYFNGSDEAREHISIEIERAGMTVLPTPEAAWDEDFEFAIKDDEADDDKRIKVKIRPETVWEYGPIYFGPESLVRRGAGYALVMPTSVPREFADEVESRLANPVRYFSKHLRGLPGGTLNVVFDPLKFDKDLFRSEKPVYQNGHRNPNRVLSIDLGVQSWDDIRDEDRSDIAGTAAHEIFHLWNTGWGKAEPPQRWMVEGTARYAEYHYLYDTGLIDEAKFAEKLAEQANRCAIFLENDGLLKKKETGKKKRRPEDGEMAYNCGMTVS